MPSRLFSLFVALLVLPACHPLACTHPADFPRDAPLEIDAKGDWPRGEVEILLDERGVPHIYAADEPDLAYGIGFMHARDRLFQLHLLKMAAHGRLTEVFGEDLLSTDQELRLVTFRLDEQVSRLEPRDWDIVDAYVAGVNAGAERAGRSAEMHILGVDFEPYTPRDVIALVRLQSWDLASGMREELARTRVRNRIARSDPRRAALLGETSSLGYPVVSAEEHTGTTRSSLSAAATERADLDDVASHPRRPRARQKLSPKAEAIRGLLGILGEPGASNVWVVSGAHTASGHPVVAHDPHLAHRGPGVFYLVHLEAPGFTLAGGTFPGLPAVLIGHGDHIAWGIPASIVDTQDLVRLTPHQGRDDLYTLDGAAMRYGTLVQRFVVGKGEAAEVREEVWRTTVFGPVLPPAYHHLLDEGEEYALQWTGFDPFESAGGTLSAFWRLARSRDVDEATDALQDFTAPPMSLGLAFTDGTIAYRLSGDVPLRKSDEPLLVPRDGRTRAAGWSDRLPPEEKPQIDNPAKGYIVAANQRIVESDGPGAFAVGRGGATAYRAQRIHERLRSLLETKKATADDILAIQQDVESVEARLLAPLLGAHCPTRVEGHPDERARALCDALRSFDARYTVDARGALPFTLLLERVQLEVLLAHLHDEDVARQVRRESFAASALLEAFLEEEAGRPSPLLDDPRTGGREGLPGFVARAAKPVLDELVERYGASPEDWRWGRAHRYQVRGVLARAPVIGFLFETASREEPGCGPCVRSERGTPIANGAVLRIVGEMSTPPKVRLVIDSGQSGHFGHRHLDDQVEPWSRGEPFSVALPRADVEGRRTGWAKIRPR